MTKGTPQGFTTGLPKLSRGRPCLYITKFYTWDTALLCLYIPEMYTCNTVPSHLKHKTLT